MFKDIKLIILLSLIIQQVFLCQQLKRIKRGRKTVPKGNSILDTGKGAIGVFLSQSVRNLQPLREHYYWKIHHCYHNVEDVKEEINVLPRDVTVCEGDAGKFCPNGTRALCTKNDAVRCLTILWETDSCDNTFARCIQVSLPCDQYTPECRTSNKDSFNVTLRCISVVDVHVNLVYVNGTMIAQDLVKIYPPHYFCETILALPAKLTKGEELFFNTSNIFGMFAVQVSDIKR